jgi:hypothetical protein
MSDPHIWLSPDAARAKGCTCEFGCRTCGMHEARMGGCPAWDPCPVGRAADPGCLLSGCSVGDALAAAAVGEQQTEQPT